MTMKIFCTTMIGFVLGWIMFSDNTQLASMSEKDWLAAIFLVTAFGFLGCMWGNNATSN